jgi:XTP/dITP diphosphohydrolase
VLGRVPDPPDFTLLEGSYDLPGARLLDLVALMDRLRSPGGCPWDARQTHQSLITYLVEEAYETVEAIETGDRVHLREELGDLLLQVVFHARIAQEHPDDAWSIDDVAVAIVDKLVRRHPHVFGTGSSEVAAAPGAEDLETTWERQKAAEKGRTSATEGVAPGLPALTLAAKLMSRAMRSGLDVPLPPGDSIGGRLLALVAEAHDAGIDPESELRRCVRLYRQAILHEEERATSSLPQ